MTEEEIEKYNAIKDLPIIKEYEKLCQLVCAESNKKAPQEVYKEINGTKYIIELPYEKLGYTNDSKLGYIQYGYNPVIKSEKGYANYCLSLCDISREKCIEYLEKEIE